MKESSRKNNLVVLYYADSGDYTRLVSATKAEKEIKGFSVNTKNDSWTFDGEIYAIERMTHDCKPSRRSGVIGVYDRTKMKHLNTMLWHAQKAIR